MKILQLFFLFEQEIFTWEASQWLQLTGRPFSILLIGSPSVETLNAGLTVLLGKCGIFLQLRQLSVKTADRNWSRVDIQNTVEHSTSGNTVRSL